MKLKENVFSSDRCKGGERERKETFFKEGKMLAYPSAGITHSLLIVASVRCCRRQYLLGKWQNYRRLRGDHLLVPFHPFFITWVSSCAASLEVQW